MGNNSPGPEIRALARNIRMSAHKARRVINRIRGRSYGQALMILELSSLVVGQYTLQEY